MTLVDLVARTLAAIHDDSPSYRGLLLELSQHVGLPALLAQPDASALMQELRKLRPVGLWVRDQTQRALSLKRELCLDGAIGLISEVDDIGAADADAPVLPVGRECWLMLPPDWNESLVRALPRGFGLVVAAGSAGTLGLLRQVAPLRAIGVVCTAPSDVPALRLDLVLFEGAVAAGAWVPEGGGARVLRAAPSLERLDATHVGPDVSGLVCDGEQALAWALRLAAVRAHAAL